MTDDKHSDDGKVGRPNLIFLFGAPRSGTTWLQRLLASNPLISTAQESDLFDVHIGPQLRCYYAYQNTGRGPLGMASYFSESEFIEVMRGHAWQLLSPAVRQLPNEHFFLEKTPSHALYLKEISQVFPDAKLIHIIRDGRDVACSICAAHRTWGSDWAPKNAREAMRMWADHVTAVTTFQSNHPHNSLCTVRYEDLLESPAAELRRICEYLKIDWSEEELSIAVNQNSFGSSTSTPIPVTSMGSSAIEPVGFERKGKAGSWRQEMGIWDRIWTNRNFAHLLTSLGYE